MLTLMKVYHLMKGHPGQFSLAIYLCGSILYLCMILKCMGSDVNVTALFPN